MSDFWIREAEWASCCALDGEFAPFPAALSVIADSND